MLHADEADSAGGSWADIVWREINIKKNLNKASDQDKKTTKMKIEVFQAL